MSTKQCVKCNKLADAEDFTKGRNRCVSCTKVYQAEYRSRNKDKQRAYNKGYYQENAEEIKKQSSEYHVEHREERKKKMRVWTDKNKSRVSLQQKKWRNSNKARTYETRKEYLKNNVGARIAVYMRDRVRKLIKKANGTKYKRTLELLGCSVNHLRFHLSSLFQEGMTWANYGTYKINGVKTWHIDHIKPCASFDLTDPEQQKMCFHYTNLQPLWAVDNLSKGAKLL